MLFDSRESYRDDVSLYSQVCRQYDDVSLDPSRWSRYSAGWISILAQKSDWYGGSMGFFKVSYEYPDV
jgi:hypothetical protein